MNAFLRRAARRTSIGLGALALAVGATACGGDDGGDTAPEQDTGVEEPAATAEEPAPSDGGGQSDAGGQELGSDASDGGGETGAAGELSQEDLDAATDRFVGFLQVIDDHDFDGACAYLLDPATGETGEGDTECTDALEQELGGMIQPGMFDQVEASMLEAEDNGDGTVTIGVMGDPFPLPMGQGEDGEWYVTGPSF